MLLNKHNLAVADFAADPRAPRPVLTTLCVTPAHTVATDGYLCVETENVKAEPKDVPKGLVSDDRPALIPVTSVRKIEKLLPKSKVFPLLESVATSVNDKGDAVTLATTDLESVNRIESRVAPGQYPEYARCFPEGEPAVRIAVNAAFLRKLADYFASHDAQGQIVLSVHASDIPIVATGKTGQGQQIRALLMPMRQPA